MNGDGDDSSLLENVIGGVCEGNEGQLEWVWRGCMEGHCKRVDTASLHAPLPLLCSLSASVDCCCIFWSGRTEPQRLPLIPSSDPPQALDGTYPAFSHSKGSGKSSGSEVLRHGVLSETDTAKSQDDSMQRACAARCGAQAVARDGKGLRDVLLERVRPLDWQAELREPAGALGCLIGYLVWLCIRQELLRSRI